MKWIRYGPHSWLIEFAGQPGEKAFRTGRAMAAELEQFPPPGLVEYVPAFTRMLLEFHPRAVPDEEGLKAIQERLNSAVRVRIPEPPIKEIPVRYEGPDLERVAELHGLRIEQVVRYHSAPVYKVYALGFSPGFAYLGELDKRLHTPRLATPRARVPAGSVAIGGSHTGVYPLETPGGWNLIGRAALDLFDAEQPDGAEAAAFYLQPGDRVRFVPSS